MKNEFKSYPDGYQKLMKKLVPWYFGPMREKMMRLLLMILTDGSRRTIRSKITAKDIKPVSFVFIKATEGTSMKDRNFQEHCSEAEKRNLAKGAYHFFSKRSSARDQAYFFLENVPLEEGDLPPILDVEHKPNDKTVEEFQRDVLTWLHIVENKYHVKPIIYTYYKEQMIKSKVDNSY